MTERYVEMVLKREKGKYPVTRSRIISDNGPQFFAKDFKEFVRVLGMTHVRTSPYYPQSNWKLELWHKTIKGECVLQGSHFLFRKRRELVEKCINHYNDYRTYKNSIFLGLSETPLHPTGISQIGSNFMIIDCNTKSL